MKYIHLVILTLFLSLTWNLVQSDQNVSELIHAEIQDDLKVLIGNYVASQVPNVKNINFKNIWSESLSDTKVKAHFKYSFDDETENIGKSGNLIDGFAILNKTDETQDGAAVWTLDEIQILNNHVTFEQGITLSPNDDDE